MTGQADPDPGSGSAGANFYIGNAPNFMVEAIAETAGYMLHSGGILLPASAALTWLFFR